MCIRDRPAAGHRHGVASTAQHLAPRCPRLRDDRPHRHPPRAWHGDPHPRRTPPPARTRLHLQRDGHRGHPGVPRRRHARLRLRGQDGLVPHRRQGWPEHLRAARGGALHRSGRRPVPPGAGRSPGGAGPRLHPDRTLQAPAQRPDLSAARPPQHAHRDADRVGSAAVEPRRRFGARRDDLRVARPRPDDGQRDPRCV